VGEERAAPGRRGVARAAAHHLRRAAPHRAAVAVDEPGLARQALAVLGHPHDVAVALAQPAGRDDVHVARVPVHLRQLLAQPAGGRAGVELGLDDDARRAGTAVRRADEVQAAGEAQQRRDLGLAAAGTRHRQP
jgi:hypothetical protein